MEDSMTASEEMIHILSLLTLAPHRTKEAFAAVMNLNEAEREQFISLADSHHVVLRALNPLHVQATDALSSKEISVAEAERTKGIQNWAAAHIDREHSRIANAMHYLHTICLVLENGSCPISVMKSLDHWPDLGNDLDLYTTANERAVTGIMTKCFHAHIEPRSWGDWLAHKQNFAIPGLPEAVEVHSQRLGQTGEQTQMAKRFISRRVKKDVAGYSFLVPAPEERIIVATLQRMYRHFYFRICDVVNSAALVESGVVDFTELRKASDLGGVWPGVCAFLKVVSGYVEQYRGRRVELPEQVLAAARFGAEKVFVRGKFIRVPLMPQGSELYIRQVAQMALHPNLPGALRLSLLLPLASAAAISYRLTGSDKGVW
jgi:hypothetical protein